MNFLRGKTLAFRVYLLAAVCVAVSAFPAYKYCVRLWDKLGHLESERIGAQILKTVSIVAHEAFLEQVNPREASTLAPALKIAVEDSRSLFEKLDEIGDNSNALPYPRTRMSVGTDALASFSGMQDKHYALSEISSYILIRSGLYADSDLRTHMLMESSGVTLPQIYSGFFALMKLIDEWSSRMDGASSASLISMSATIDDDCKDLTSALRRTSAMAGSDMAAMTGALAKFNMAATELNTAISRAWRDRAFSIDQVEVVLAETERTLNDLWGFTNAMLLESFDARMHAVKVELAVFLSVYGILVLGAFVFAAVFMWRISKAVENTIELARLADIVPERAVDFYSAISTQCAEFVVINSYINSFVQKNLGVSSTAKAVSTAAEKMNAEADTFVHKQKSRIDGLSKSLRRMTSKTETDAAFGRSVSDGINRLRDGLNKMEQSVANYSKDAFDASASIGGTVDSYTELAKSFENARATAEKMSFVSEAFTSLAEQANIISLNLSIELAKAGVKGTGLNTIAEQIRVMSKRTVVSVLDIDSIREAVVKTLGESICASGDFSVVLRANAKMVKELNESLSALSERIGEISKSASDIAASVRGYRNESKAEDSLRVINELDFSLSDFQSVVKNAASVVQRLGERLGPDKK